MTKKARYICLEGTEGVGKTTQTQKLVDTLRDRGYSVLQTKEPGTPLVPLTMMLRQIMLDKQYDETLTKPAREYISQAIRSIHLERLVIPALSTHDFIIQDRGILSGYAYGMACGNDFRLLQEFSNVNILSADPEFYDYCNNPNQIYDTVIYLRGDSVKGLQKAKLAKQEYTAGDAMESRGNDFISQAGLNMDLKSELFNSVRIDVDGKSIEEVHSEIMNSLRLGTK